jgi:hypothetical protein
MSSFVIHSSACLAAPVVPIPCSLTPIGNIQTHLERVQEEAAAMLLKNASCTIWTDTMNYSQMDKA